MSISVFLKNVETTPLDKGVKWKRYTDERIPWYLDIR